MDAALETSDVGVSPIGFQFEPGRCALHDRSYRVAAALAALLVLITAVA